jgi:hypothetical protein
MFESCRIMVGLRRWMPLYGTWCKNRSYTLFWHAPTGMDYRWSDHGRRCSRSGLPVNEEYWVNLNRRLEEKQKPAAAPETATLIL